MAITKRIDYETSNGWTDFERKQKSNDGLCTQIGLQTLSDQFTRAGSFGLVTPRVGTMCAEFRVRPGDFYASGCYENRILGQWFESPTEGSHYFYKWHTLYPSQPGIPSQWFIFTEVHAAAGKQAPFQWRWGNNSIELAVRTGRMSPASGGGTNFETNAVHPIHNISYGLWNDYVFEVFWTGTFTGYYRQWHRLQGQSNYTLVAERTNVKTFQFNEDGSFNNHYWTLGMYRNATSGYTNTVYCDDFIRGDTFAEVTDTGPGTPPPPTNPPNTFGYAANQGITHGSITDSIRVCRFTATSVPANSVIDSLFMWIEPASSGGQELRKLVIYSDSSGEPNTLLGTTEELTFEAGMDAGWYEFAFASPIALSAGTTAYWLGDLCGGTQNLAITRNGQQTTQFRYATRTYTSGPPTTWDTANDQSFDVQMAIYAEWRLQTAAIAGQAVISENALVTAAATVTGTPSAGIVVPNSMVVWVPNPLFAVAQRGESREIDANGNILGPVKWNETLDQWERI